ncbi:hypothetical protein GCM10010254_70690 [Streptomyces chromofuscus]|nr:hypothetical protein GCM10010254_70690 [Streptomyces chromofuscus]
MVGPLSSPTARACGAAAAETPTTEAAIAAVAITFLITGQSFLRKPRPRSVLVNCTAIERFLPVTLSADIPVLCVFVVPGDDRAVVRNARANRVNLRNQSLRAGLMWP